ncbi:MAG: PAS domain-containing protein, partial [Victivallaceae bacterium]
ERNSDIPHRLPVLGNCSTRHMAEKRKHHTNQTTVGPGYDVLASLSAGKKLFGDDAPAFVIADDTAESRADLAALRKALPENWRSTVTLIDGAEYSNSDALLESLRKRSSGAFAVFLPWHGLRSDRYPSREVFFQAFVREVGIPFFVSTDAVLGKGALGGYLSENRENAEVAVDSARAILRQGSAAAVADRVGDAAPIFDHAAIRAAKADPDRLGRQVEFINRPPDWLEILVSPAFLGMLIWSVVISGALIGISVAFFRFYRKTNFANLLLAAMPVRIFIFDRAGNIRYRHIGRGQHNDNNEVIASENVYAARIQPSTRDKILKAVNKVLDEGGEYSDDFEYADETRRTGFSQFDPAYFKTETAICVSLDITELNRLRYETAIEAERYKLTLEAIGDAVVVTDEHENVTMMNAVAAALTGYRPEEVAGTPLANIFRIVSYLDETPMPSPLAKAISTGKIVELANHTDLIARDGSRFHIADSAAPIRNGRGDIIGGILVFRDVTNEYDLRDKMRRSHQLLKESESIASLGYFNCKPEDEVCFCALLDDTMWPRRDGRPLPFDQWVHRDDAGPLQEGWNRLRQKEIPELKVSYRGGHGADIRYFVLRAVLSRGEYDHHDSIYGLVHEVTEFKRSEMAAHDSLKMMETFFDAVEGYIFVKDVRNDFRFVYVNKNFCRYIGKPREEIIGKNNFEVLDRAVAEISNLEDIQASESKIETTRAVMVEGQMRFHRIIKAPFRRANGEHLLIGVGFDINDIRIAQQQAEDALLLIDNMLNAMPGGLFAKDLTDEFRYILANETIARYAGLNSRDDLVGKTDFEFFPPALAEQFRRDDLAIAARGSGEVLEDLTVNGETVFLKTHKLVYRNSTGHQILVGVATDVSDLKRAEEQQSATIARLETYIRHEKITRHFLELVVSERDFASVLNDIVADAGPFFGADRAYIFEYSGDDTVSNIIEWCAPEITPQIDNMQNLAVSVFRPWYQQLETTDRIIIPEVAAMDPADPFRALLQSQDIKSLLLMGIRSGGRLRGFCGFDFVRETRVIADADSELLGNIASIIGIGYERNERKRELERNVEELNRINLHQSNLLVQMEINQECFEILTNEKNLDDALRRVVTRVGTLFRADTCAIFVYRGELVSDFALKAVWDRNGDGDTLRNIPKPLTAIKDFIWENEYLYALASERNFPPELQADLDFYFEHYQVRTLFCRRIMVGGKVWGHLGLHCREELRFGDNETGLMNLIGRTLQIYIGRDLVWQQALREEQLKNLIFEVAPVPLLIFDADQNVIAANSKTKEVFGLGDGAVLSEKPCHDIFCLEEGIDEDCPVRRTLESGEPQYAMRPMRHRDFQVCTRPIVKDGKVVTVLEALVDVTELNENRRLVESYLSNSMILRRCTELIVTNGEKKVTLDAITAEIGKALGAEICCIVRNRHNQSMVESAWYRPGYEIRLPEPLVVTPHCLEAFRSGHMLTAIRGDSSLRPAALRAEVEAYFDYFQIDAAACNLINFNGEYWGHIGFMRRGTTPFAEPELRMMSEAARVVEMLLLRNSLDRQLWQKERDLRAALTASQAAERAKSTFLATMSHEIRTPLNAVIGLSELLQSQSIGQAEQREYIENINIAGNALLRLINDILDLSKLEAEQLTLQYEFCDITELVSDICSIFKHISKKKNIPLILEIPEKLPLISIDIQRLRQILLNLIGNAMKFTHQGEVRCDVAFSVTGAKSGRLEISVKDTGIGISEEAMRRIFDPFVQLHDVRGARVYQGTGLGLAIAKKMLEKMGGELKLQSEIGKGSIFTIILNDLDTDEPAAAEVPPPHDADPVRPGWPARRVLLVDDIPINLKVLKAKLQPFNIECRLAASGAEALSMLDKDKPDMILTDIWMPEMDGSALARKVRELDGFEDMPIVAVTADIEAGANFDMSLFSDVLLKPLAGGKIEELLRRFPVQD